MILPLYDRPHAAIALLLLGASAAGGCAQQAGQPVAETCQATQEVLEGVVNGDLGESGESVDGFERRLSAVIERLVEAAHASGEPSLRQPADRLSAAWRESLADDEAAPAQDFGVEMNQLASECVDRGFTYPQLGFD